MNAQTDLSSLIVFTADKSNLAVVVSTRACQYTGIHGKFQDVHGSREPECDRRGVDDTDTIIPRWGRCHDQ